MYSRMKTLYRFVFLLFVLFCFALTLQAQPKLAVKEGSQFQLGEVKEGVVLKKQLTLMNVGTELLTIDDIRTSCGCAIAKTEKKQLKAGETTTLSINIDTKDSKGPLKKQVFITTNESKDKEYEIVMFVTVRNVIEFKPIFLNFHTIAFGTTVYDTVTVHNTSDKPFTITSLKSPDSQITLRLSNKTIPARDSGKLIATLTPKKKGQVLGQFEIKTNIPEKKVVKLSFIGKIR